jgi:Cu+-exporting ATPase
MTSRVASLTDISIAITGMSCASCAGRLEKQLAKLTEIDGVSVNIATESAHIHLNSAISFHTLSRTIEQAGYGIATDDLHLDVKGMSCASCVGRVEKVLSNLNGVLDVSVNLATESAHVRVAKECISPDTLVNALREGGYAANVHHETIEPNNTASPKIDRETSHLIIAALLSAPMVFAMIFDAAGFELMPPAWLQFLLATPIQFWLGARFYRAAWFAVKAGTGNMDLLVALGTSASYGLSVFQLISEYLSPSVHQMGHYYFEASAVVITLVLLGKWLENRAKHQTTAAIRALQALDQPPQLSVNNRAISRSPSIRLAMVTSW